MDGWMDGFHHYSADGNVKCRVSWPAMRVHFVDGTVIYSNRWFLLVV